MLGPPTAQVPASQVALEGERKQVTVLFADLKGSLELLAGRDPEDARRLLDPVLERMMESVHRYEGTVNQVMGDGIMALFGAPVAQEDHALRACRAALAMHEAVARQSEQSQRDLGASARIRVGLNSGEVVVRMIGSDLRMDYTAVGQTTHLAARMEQLARPGGILLAPSTAALVEGEMELRPLGPVPVKGLGQPVEIYELTGAGPARTRLLAAARRGLTSFVGRAGDLERIVAAQEAAAGGAGQVVGVAGEAGVGKSRLLHEFAHSERLHGWLVLEAVAVSYGKGVSYLPLVELLRRHFRIGDHDGPDEISARITAGLFAFDRSLAWALLPLLALMDAPGVHEDWRRLDPAQRRQRTLEAVAQLLRHEARARPLLLIVEDLHWADSETLACLDFLFERIASDRLLAVVSYRSDYRHVWAADVPFREVRLQALAAQTTASLLDALLGGDSSLDPLKQLLVERGNPFFLEETVRMLADTKALAGERGNYRLVQPVHSIEVAPTVQPVLAARIDRLPPQAKSLLQVASVIGKHLPLALLRATAELPDHVLREVLEQLQASDLLYETGPPPAAEYGFKHALTHEVAYGAMLRERRRALHARVAQALESLHHGHLGPHTERLAYHAQRGELWDKAVRYLRKAGRRAAERSALGAAAAWFEQAIEVLAKLPQNRPTLEKAFDIRLELRAVLAQLGEGAQELARLREAEAIAGRLGDAGRQAWVGAFTTSVLARRGELDEAIAAGEHAVAAALAAEALDLRIIASSLLAPAHYFRADYGRVVELTTANLAALPAEWMHESFGSTTPASIFDRHWLVMALAQLGRFAEAARYAAQAIRIVRPRNHTHSVLQAYYAAGTLRLVRGEWAKARSLFERGIALLPAGNPLLMLPWSVASCAWALAELGDSAGADARLQMGEELLERHARHGILGQAGWAFHSLGCASLALGRLDDARRLAARAIASSPCHPGFAAHALHLRGDIAAHPEGFDAAEAEANYRNALALAEPRAMRPLVAHCCRGLGEVALRTGRQDEARRRLDRAAALYREMDLPARIAQIPTKAASPAQGAPAGLF
ncbi:MAG: adenylate/guanylate cyclase domain-containing protein [Pseudomonadota bacterium]